ncbi:MAG: ABC transporter permease, partial [Pseudomonadota bacterium]
ATVQISIQGNHALTPEDMEEIRAWPETGFVEPATRSLARTVTLRSERSRRFEEARLQPTGPGDPLLPAGLLVTGEQVALSHSLARRLSIGPGDRFEAIVRRGDDLREVWRLGLDVVAVLQRGQMNGNAVLATPILMDEIEAFIDTYALPHHGITRGDALSERIVSYENMRLYAVDIFQVGALEQRIEDRFTLVATSEAARIARDLGLSDSLGLALAVILGAALIGLSAALVSSLWASVQRKRVTLSILALSGVPPLSLALFPAIQALVIAVTGTLSGFAIFALGAGVAEGLFAGRLSADQTLVVMPAVTVLSVILGMIALASLAAAAASVRAMRSDPALVIRGDTT